MTPFQRVSEMNEAFGNPKGDYSNIDIDRVRSQAVNIGHEFLELMEALGLKGRVYGELEDALDDANLRNFNTSHDIDIIAVRDALCDIQVFAQGTQHFMGVDGDADMHDVVDGVMTRFIKDEADKQATIAKHAAKGVTDVYFEGNYPKMVMKSASDQPDAPKGKFLKSASYRETVFRDPPANV